jgi:hypothetical protein
VLGLVIAAIFAAAMSSIDSTLNALSGATVVDIYRRWLRPAASEAHAALRMGKLMTLFWGVVATAMALFFAGGGSVIEQINRFGSFFYGSLLGIFALALFVPRAGGRAGALGLLGGMATVLCVHFTLAGRVPLVQRGRLLRRARRGARGDRDRTPRAASVDTRAVAGGLTRARPREATFAAGEELEEPPARVARPAPCLAEQALHARPQVARPAVDGVVAALEVGDAGARHLAAPQADQVEAVDLVAFGGDRVRRHVVRDRGVAADHRAGPDAHELVHAGAAADERAVADVHVAGQHDVVGERHQVLPTCSRGRRGCWPSACSLRRAT